VTPVRPPVAPCGALLLIDLDGFKDVNDTLGHPVGDLLLMEVAKRLSEVHGPADTLARLGGDEFALLLNTAPAQARATAAAALEALRPPFSAPGGHQIYVTGSLGLLDLALGVADPAVALQEADLALYAAKAAGKNQVVEFHPRLRESRVRRATLVAELRSALKESRLALHYQPIVDLATGATTAVEALLRWPTTTGTFVAPGEFIPLAEETGLVVELGTQVLRDACRAARAWAGDHDVSLSVNVSGRQVTSSTFADLVLRTLTETGLPADALILEITESVLVGGGETRSAATVGRNLRRLRHHGVRIAVDDFGTGYSSLAALHQLPIDILKIDKSFVAPLDGQAGPRATFAEAILRMAESLRLTTIAEGVETAAQATALRALGCPLAQGYLLGRPVPADRVTHDLSATAVPTP
jgi:diguanylate cyclase (GGDEF)-like protein